MATVPEDTSARRPLLWSLALFLPLALGWGVLVVRTDLFFAALTAETLLWIGLRFWVLWFSRRRVANRPAQSLDENEILLAVGMLALLFVLGGGTFLAWWQFGWLGASR